MTNPTTHLCGNSSRKLDWFKKILSSDYLDGILAKWSSFLEHYTLLVNLTTGGVDDDGSNCVTVTERMCGDVPKEECETVLEKVCEQIPEELCDEDEEEEKEIPTDTK